MPDPVDPQPVPARSEHVELPDGQVHRLATVGERVKARLVDTAIVWGGWAATAVFSILAIVVLGADAVPAVLSVFGWLALVLLWLGVIAGSLLYEPWMIAKHGGRTVGKRVAGIKVINDADGGTPGWGQSWGRWAVPQGCSLVTSLLFLPVGGLICYLSATWHHQRRGWHDLLAHTLVVESPLA